MGQPCGKAPGSDWDANMGMDERLYQEPSAAEQQNMGLANT